MERVIEFSPREWEQLKSSVDDIRVKLCRKAGFGQKPAFKGFSARRGLDLPEWKRLDGELSFPSVKDENTVIFNYYDDPRGKGAGVKSGKGSYSGPPRREVMTFSFDGERLRVPIEGLMDLKSIVGFLHARTLCRKNVIELHSHMADAMQDGIKTGDFRPPLFQSVDVLTDGDTKHYFFDQSDPVLENRLRHEEGVVLHMPEELPRVMSEVMGVNASREGAAPSLVRKYYNGDGLVSRGELMHALDSEGYGQAARDEVALELAVRNLNRTVLCTACAMAGIEPEQEDLVSGFVPSEGKVLSYERGGALSVLHGDSAFGPRSGASNLPEAIQEVFSRQNLSRVGEEYQSFCIERARSRGLK